MVEVSIFIGMVMAIQSKVLVGTPCTTEIERAEWYLMRS